MTLQTVEGPGDKGEENRGLVLGGQLSLREWRWPAWMGSSALAVFTVGLTSPRPPIGYKSVEEAFPSPALNSDSTAEIGLACEEGGSLAPRAGLLRLRAGVHPGPQRGRPA